MAGLNRHQFRWILFDDYEIVEFVVEIDGSLCFRVEIPSRATRGTSKFTANLNDFLQRSQDADLLFGQLALYSQETTADPTQPLSPRSRPNYLFGKQIGKGSFGKVHEVRNVSTGAYYAAKSFMPGFNFNKEVEILRSLSHVGASNSCDVAILTCELGAHFAVCGLFRRVMDALSGDGLHGLWTSRRETE